MADDLHELSALYALDALDGRRACALRGSTSPTASAAAASSPGSQGAAASLAFAVDGPGAARGAARRASSTQRGPRARTSSRSGPAARLALSVAAAVAVAATAAAVAFGVWAASLAPLALARARCGEHPRRPPGAHVAVSGARGAARRRAVGRRRCSPSHLPAPPHGQDLRGVGRRRASCIARVSSSGKTVDVATTRRAGATA